MLKQKHIPPCKANSQSQTTTFEHLQLGKLRDGISGRLISQDRSEIKRSSWILLNASQNLNHVLDVPRQHWEMSQSDRGGHFVYEASVSAGNMEVLACLQRRVL